MLILIKFVGGDCKQEEKVMVIKYDIERVFPDGKTKLMESYQEAICSSSSEICSYEYELASFDAYTEYERGTEPCE